MKIYPEIAEEMAQYGFDEIEAAKTWELIEQAAPHLGGIWAVWEAMKCVLAPRALDFSNVPEMARVVEMLNPPAPPVKRGLETLL